MKCINMLVCTTEALGISSGIGCGLFSRGIMLLLTFCVVGIKVSHSLCFS